MLDVLKALQSERLMREEHVDCPGLERERQISGKPPLCVARCCSIVQPSSSPSADDCIWQPAPDLKTEGLNAHSDRSLSIFEGTTFHANLPICSVNILSKPVW